MFAFPSSPTDTPLRFFFPVSLRFPLNCAANEYNCGHALHLPQSIPQLRLTALLLLHKRHKVSERRASLRLSAASLPAALLVWYRETMPLSDYTSLLDRGGGDGGGGAPPPAFPKATTPSSLAPDWCKLHIFTPRVYQVSPQFSDSGI